MYVSVNTFHLQNLIASERQYPDERHHSHCMT